jgi:hypothetical protein
MVGLVARLVVIVYRGFIETTRLFSVMRVAVVSITGVGRAVVIVVSSVVATGVAVILARVVGVARGGDCLDISATVILGVEFLLQNQELFTIFLLDSSKSVDIVLELCPSSLLPLGVGQPPPEALHQLVVGHPPPTRQHQLPH